MAKYRIVFAGAVELDAEAFFGDEPQDGDYGLEAAAASLAEYIKQHGVSCTLEEWGISDCLTVLVEGPTEVKRVVVVGDAVAD